jgi:hypothetical protein
MIKDEELAPLLGELVESWREVLTLEGSETTSRLQMSESVFSQRLNSALGAFVVEVVSRNCTVF